MYFELIMFWIDCKGDLLNICKKAIMLNIIKPIIYVLHILMCMQMKIYLLITINHSSTAQQYVDNNILCWRSISMKLISFLCYIIQIINKETLICVFVSTLRVCVSIILYKYSLNDASTNSITTLLPTFFCNLTSFLSF